MARDILDELRGHSITYRIALGPHAGRKALTLQTLPSRGEFAQGLARANGFSRHAGVVAAADERDKLERLCRYITRPAVSAARWSLTAQGFIHYRLKTPYRDGNARGVTTGILPFALRLFKIAPGDFVEPLDFMARLAALVPAPRANRTRSHGAIDRNWRTESLLV